MLFEKVKRRIIPFYFEISTVDDGKASESDVDKRLQQPPWHYSFKKKKRHAFLLVTATQLCIAAMH